MNIINVVFQILGGLVVLWMLAVALVALFNVVGNALLALAANLGVFVERASLGTIHVINTAGVYDRPVVVAKAGIRQPAEQPRQQQQEQPKQPKPQQQQQQGQQHNERQQSQAQPQPQPQQQQQQQQQAKPQDSDGLNKVWQRLQKLENDLNQVRNSNKGGGGNDQQTAKALAAILDKLETLDERMTDLENNQDTYMDMYTEIDAKVQEMTQGRLY